MPGGGGRRIVCGPARRAASLLHAHEPSHVVTLFSPGEAPPVLAGVLHLHRAFHDIDRERPGLVAPSPDDIRAVIGFADGWDGRRPILVVCSLGISRSPAVAFLLACRFAPGRAEIDLARQLRDEAPCATPNSRIVSIGDARLGRNGRMTEATASIGRGADYREQGGFVLALAD